MERSISEAAQEAGLTAYTLRYYDKEGLLPFVKRTSGGGRRFTDTDMSWLQLISCMKTIGMSVKEIRQYIAWCRAGDRTLQRRHDFFVAKRAETVARIAELKKSLAKFEFKINYYNEALAAGTDAIHGATPMNPAAPAKKGK